MYSLTKLFFVRIDIALQHAEVFKTTGIIPRTIAELAAIVPAMVVPGHCTGRKATHELARLLPGAYVQTSVGTRLHLE